MGMGDRWRTSTAIGLTLSMITATAVPLSASASSAPYRLAQSSPGSYQLRVPAGITFPVSYSEAERIVVTPDEILPVTLQVGVDLRSPLGTVLVPAGSDIQGELRPTSGGTQFVAQDVILSNSGQRLPFYATSNVVTRKERISRRNGDAILRGAAVGAAAGAVLAEIFGRIDLIDVVGGAGIGALAGLITGGNREVEVLVVEPARDLNLTLQSDFVR